MNKIFAKKEIKTFPAEMASVSEILDYTIQCYDGKAINARLSAEYRLVIEEVLLKLLDKARVGSEISIESYSQADSVMLKLSCPGKPVLLYQENEEDLGGRLIEEYQDYLKQSYAAGVNEVTFTISSGYGRFRLQNLRILLLAVISAVILYQVLSEDQIKTLTNSFILPADRFFIGCLQAISAPLIFFSVASLIIRLRYKFEHEKHMVTLFVRYIVTSIVAVTIGYLTVQMFSGFLSFYDYSSARRQAYEIMGDTLQDFIAQFTFTNIVDPFMDDNPLSLLILAAIMGIAASGLFGKEGGLVRRNINALSKIFAKMMTIVHSTIPAFVFLAVLRGCFAFGTGLITELLLSIMIFLPAVLILLAVYALQLAASGINPIGFVREYKDILYENLKIGSNMDALPYNKRVMCRKSTMPIHMVKEGLTLGAMVNMDGNCLALSACTFFCMFSCRYALTPAKVISIILIIVMISIGAPNQPGSFLLGMVFIMKYVGITSDWYEAMIIFEAIFGILYSFVNSIGDIVALATDSRQWEKRRQ